MGHFDIDVRERSERGNENIGLERAQGRSVGIIADKGQHDRPIVEELQLLGRYTAEKHDFDRRHGSSRCGGQGLEGPVAVSQRSGIACQQPAGLLAARPADRRSSASVRDVASGPGNRPAAHWRAGGGPVWRAAARPRPARRCRPARRRTRAGRRGTSRIPATPGRRSTHRRSGQSLPTQNQLSSII